MGRPVEYITIKQAAEIMKTSTRTLQRMISRGLLVAFKPAGRVLLRRQDVIDRIKENKQVAV